MILENDALSQPNDGMIFPFKFWQIPFEIRNITFNFMQVKLNKKKSISISVNKFCNSVHFP